MKALRLFLLLSAGVGLLAPPALPSTARAAGPLDPINHVIVIYQENWSFDSLYGSFPGANGISAGTVTQVDNNGRPYTTLPQPLDTGQKPAVPDPRFPANLPVQPFNLGAYVSPDAKIGDLPGGFYQEQAQIDSGKMDRFVTRSSAAGLTMGYYNADKLPEGRLAADYTLADNFYHAAFGGSFLNHQWLICACTPAWPNAPAGKIAQLDGAGQLVKDGPVTSDGYVVNTAYTINSPHPAIVTDTTQLVPEQTAPTIGDRLNDKGISWAWYAGGWNDAVAGHPDKLFQFHHQPFAYYAGYADGTSGRAAHLRDEQDFLRALSTNDLPAVSFVKALGADNEHPGYATLVQGQQHVADLVNAVKNSPYWAATAVIITYDENGGFWDHAAPPVADRWGLGTRVPTIIVSPFAKKSFVDHTQYDTTSILRTIELRWNLAPLGTRAAAPLTNAFSFPAAVSAGMPVTGAGTDLRIVLASAVLAGLLVSAGFGLHRRHDTSV